MIYFTESACRELVSSEFIDECLRGGLPREFELVQNGGLLSHKYCNYFISLDGVFYVSLTARVILGQGISLLQRLS